MCRRKKTGCTRGDIKNPVGQRCGRGKHHRPLCNRCRRLRYGRLRDGCKARHEIQGVNSQAQTGPPEKAAELLGNISTVSDSNHQDNKLLVPDVADNTVISEPVPPKGSESPVQSLFDFIIQPDGSCHIFLLRDICIQCIAHIASDLWRNGLRPVFEHPLKEI